MKIAILISLCLLLVLPALLQGAGLDLTSLLTNPATTTPGDSLSGKLMVFAHLNWNQVGGGIGYDKFILMYNTSVLPQLENIKADSSAAALQNQSYETINRYKTIMAGYMIDLSSKIYPFIGLGTATLTRYYKVTNNFNNPPVFTIKGTDTTYGTGIAGFIYQYNRHLFITGSVQYKPLVPFVGAGFIL